MTDNICIYHGNCADGFGAAWAVREYAKKEQRSGRDIVNWAFHPGIYGQTPPDVTNKIVYLVDFCYKAEELIEMIGKAKAILILDHHKTAEAELKKLDKYTYGRAVDMSDQEAWHHAQAAGMIYAVFDMNKSGAMLAYDFFHYGVTDGFGQKASAPMLLQHIQDRDLWKFELPGTREIQAALFSYPYDFEVWDKLMNTDPKELISEGKAIERKHFKDINELLETCKRRMIIDGHNVPVASLPYTMSSDAGHIMGKGEPFAACYMDSSDGRVFSLRSAPDGLDVSEIAKKYGGGGHKHAAGFKISLEKAWEMEKTNMQEM